MIVGLEELGTRYFVLNLLFQGRPYANRNLPLKLEGSSCGEDFHGTTVLRGGSAGAEAVRGMRQREMAVQGKNNVICRGNC